MPGVPSDQGWPVAIAAQVEQRLGGPFRVERLGSMSVARVWRASHGGMSVVVKASPRGREAAFYASIAPGLRQSGVPIAEATALGQFGGEHWLLVEDLPVANSFAPPGDGWTPDPDGIAALVALHAATRGAAYDLGPIGGGMGWLVEATFTAVSCFPDETRDGVLAAIEALWQSASELEPAWCWVSGDPSPPNWGRRRDGTLVLFDWELFRPGCPAHDLAPFVPGLQPRRSFTLAAEAYVRAWEKAHGGFPWTASELAAQTIAAKAATVVALLNAHATGAANIPAAYLADVLATFPSWLEAMR
jgi:hypothetical protein